ncbi:hypothetical protein BKA69DRAFT_1091236 [Paraphysoderma sedebokerense]|nr:hypothetical protein BKA69DRAFT_1091236 [Paraphysoderma sedebokerense]
MQAIAGLLNYQFDKGEVGAAEELVSTAKENWGLVMNSELLESMLCGYIKKRQNDKAILLYADARRLNIHPSFRLFCKTASVLLDMNSQSNSRFISFEAKSKVFGSSRLKLDSKLSDSIPKSNPFSILEAMMLSLKSPIEIRSRSHAQIIQSLFRLLWKSPYALSVVNMITHLLSSPKNVVPDTIVEPILEPSIPSVKIENIASQYLAFLSAQNREPSPRMLERLIYVFANAQKPHQAIQLFYQLESYRNSSSSSTSVSKPVSPPTESLYSAILLSFPSQPSFAAQHIPTIINSLFTNHPTPKLSTLSSIITMYTRLNDIESALSYYNKLESHFGYTPTLEIHTTILHGYIQSRQFNSATALFNELQSQCSTSEPSINQVTLDTPILNVIMNAYRSQGRMEDVWRVYHHIEDTTGLDGTSLLVLLRAVITHYHSIKSQLGSTDVSMELKFEKVKDVMRRVCGNGNGNGNGDGSDKILKLDRRHWHSYIHICGVSGNQEEFIWIFKKMCRPISPCSPLSSSHSSAPPSFSPPRSRNHLTQHHHTPTKKTYTLLFSYLYPSPISFHTTHTHNFNNQEPESESSRLLKLRSRLHYLFKRTGKGRKCIVKSETVKEVMVKRIKETVGSQWMYHGKI